MWENTAHGAFSCLNLLQNEYMFLYFGSWTVEKIFLESQIGLLAQMWYINNL